MRIRVFAVSAVVVAASSLIVAAPAQAASFVVGPGGGAGVCSAPPYDTIEEVVAAAELLIGADTIVVCPGTYAPSVRVLIEDDLTFMGSDAATTTITGSDAHGIFLVDNAAVVISGLTLTGGSNVDAGGAIQGFGTSTIAISDSVISGNLALIGGGAVANTGPITITDSVLSSNTALSLGGAVLSTLGTVTVTGSSFSGNSVPSPGGQGGAVYTDGSAVLTDTTFSGNAAEAFGGAVYADGLATITGSTFTGNAVSTAAGRGGAVIAGTVTATTTTFTGNSARLGGAINTDVAIIGRSTFSGNSASQYGGAVRTGAGGLQSWNSTYSGNSADSSGGALYIDGGEADLANVTFTGNSAVDFGASVRSSALVAVNVIFGDVDGCAFPSEPDVTDDGGNLAVGVATNCPGTPVTDGELALQPLAGNGGPTQTIALGEGSVGIDAGLDGACAAAPVDGIDQRGYARPVGDACDTGAFEYRGEPPVQDPAQLPPPWFQAIARGGSDVCPNGYAPSWAQWPNEAQGGYTCESVILYDPSTGKWNAREGFVTD